jgi:putative ABC transport system permease protein
MPLRNQAASRHIGKQVVLPWRQSIRICAGAIKTRPSRSLLTLSGVVLAVAFMAGVMTSAKLVDAVVRQGDTNTVFALSRSMGLDVGSEAARLIQRRRDTWLIGLSIAVATVGIANSVLMSVTERFREIGTMKCLGALDSFIVRLFFLESAFAGLLGSAVGAILGIALAAGRLAAVIGPRAFPFGSLAEAAIHVFASALAVGTLITVLAAIYPAYVAARMQPVEALRVEE